MKKILFIFLLLGIIFSLSSCEEENKSKISKKYETYTIQSGSIKSGGIYSGFAQGIQQVDLAPKTGGRVVLLNVKKGDTVYKGELLAKLDGSEANSSYNTANNILKSLNILKQSTIASYDAQIESLKQNIQKSQTNLKGLELGTKNTKNITDSEILLYKNKVSEAEISLQSIKNKLKETKNILEGSRIHLYKNGINSITNSVILDTSIINFIDELIGITEKNKDKNNDFDEYLGAKKTSLLPEIKEKFILTEKKYLDYKKYYETVIENKQPSDSEIIQGLQQGKDLTNNLKELLRLTYEVLDYSIESISLPLEKINSYKQEVTYLGQEIEKSLITISGEYVFGLQGILQSIETLKRETQSQITNLENNVKLAEKNLEISKQNLLTIKSGSDLKNDSIETQREVSALTISEIEFSIQSLEKKKDAEISKIDAQIKEVIGQKNTANIGIQNSKIIAPFSGIITGKYTEIGQVIPAGSPVYTLSDNSKIKLNIGVNTQLLEQISYDSLVQISFEGINKTFTGTITNIPQVKNINTKQTEIEIIIPNYTSEIQVGMIAQIIFPEIRNINSKTNNIIIPNSALVENFLIPGVYLIDKDKKIKFQQVKIINQNDSNSEIQGLNIGDTIIITGQENLYDGEKLQ